MTETQLDLWSSPTPFRADGETFDAERDSDRLGRQMTAVRACLSDGNWWTLARLSRAVGGSEASVSARIRDLRKDRFGGHTVERAYAGEGVWKYRLALPA
jgi:hypothetical protein